MLLLGEDKSDEELLVLQAKEIKTSLHYCSEEKCCICLDNEGFLNDAIVYCDICGIAVHQQCYMGTLMEKVPDGKFYCFRCNELLEYANKQGFISSLLSIKCEICSESNGALFKMKNSNRWFHYVCVNWITPIYLRSDFSIEKIQSYIPQYSSKKCLYCDRLNGDKIKCDVPRCLTYFHVICAIKNDIILDSKHMDSLAIDFNPYSKPVYCERHLKQALKDPRFLSSESSESDPKEIKEKRKVREIKEAKEPKKVSYNKDTRISKLEHSFQIKKIETVKLVTLQLPGMDDVIAILR